MPSNRSRNRRRGQRRRARVHYHKVTNQITNGLLYSNATNSFSFSNFGPQITNVESSLPNPALMYYVVPTFYDIYSNADFEQKTELDGLANVFSQRKLCRFKVTVTPRVSDVYSTTGDPTTSNTTGQTGPLAPYLLVPFFDGVTGISQVVTNGDHTRAYRDMRGAKLFRSDQSGSIIVKPRIAQLHAAGAGGITGYSPGTFADIVAIGTQPSPWTYGSIDGAGVTTRANIRNFGVLIVFPAGIKITQYDLTLTYYIAYRGNF